jgi:insecticidal toxin complex protein TccC
MSNIHHNTPTLKVIDGRGVQVREVAYLCNESIAQPQARMTRYRHHISGQIIEQYSQTATTSRKTADSKQIRSLSGALLLTQSTDAGWRLSFFGEAGQVLGKWDARNSHWEMDYDKQLRPTVIYEESTGSTRQAIERFSYADNSDIYAKKNQCGRLIRHDDPAGSLHFSEFDLRGNLLNETRHFLKDQQAANWPEEPEQRDDLLDSGASYSTTWQYAPTDEILVQEDAKGNTQRFWFDITGQLRKATLQLNGADDQRLVFDQADYNAQGQITTQTLGSKITSKSAYTPENGRVLQRTIARSSGSTLQKLKYTYDPVGNVSSVQDTAKPEQHNANQLIKPVSSYVYDSLYQLVQASGREEQDARIHAPLPKWSSRSGDRSRLLSFTQRYTYDEQGNLIKLQHQREGNNYTREMRTAPGSNRALSWKTGDPEPDFQKSFDANGNLQSLQAGQSMEWNARNQLHVVTLVERTEQEADTESYLYDGNGQRVRKRQTQKMHATVNLRDVIYLPGLEIRESTLEKLEVITVQAGNCSVRCLHWSLGSPSSIANDALRYTFDDHLGSNTMELDAEGNLISEEGYYPFGGTAWRAARNAIEANYRTIRYSGKERDASGLYYYGMRYYAPWLQRWISPDPAGAVDGLNLYCMVGNNPVRFVDQQGLGKEEIVKEFAALGRSRSQEIMTAATQAYPGNTPAKQEAYRKKNLGSHPDYQFTKNLLTKQLVVHSYGLVGDSDLGFSDYFNLTGPKSGPTGYRGVEKEYAGTATSPDFYLTYGSYRINNTAEYLSDLSSRYSAVKADPIHQILADTDVLEAEPTLSRTIDQVHELQQPIRDLIGSHIENSNGIIPVRTGGPGAHAEVRLLNSIVALYPGRAERVLSDTYLFTDTLFLGNAPQPFIACSNCSGIIPEEVNILTDRTPRNYAGYNAHVRQINGRET